MTYEIRNAQHNGLGGIDLEWQHPERGWEWFTASPGDPVELGRELFEQALAGTVAPFVPLTAEQLRAAMGSLTRRQLKLGLLQNGITSEQVTASIEAMPAGTAKEVAKIEWADATTFERSHPLISSIGGALGLSEAQIDDMWTAAATL